MPKILVVDDNSNIQKMVANALKDQGIEVVGLGNGEAAVKKFSDVNPDMVLADVFMPVRDGYELCQWVKDNDKFSHIPVIMLVGAFDPLDEHRMQSVRADGVLKKPFVPPDRLINMVTAMLERVAQSKQANQHATALKDAHHEFAASVPHHDDEPSPAKTQKLEPEQVSAMTEPEMPEYAVQPKRIEFGEGDSTLAFGDLLGSPAELSASIDSPAAESSAPSFRASSIPDDDHAPVALEPQPSETLPTELHAEVDLPPAPAIEEPAEDETPNYGGITEELKQPSPDEPPIKVEFGEPTPMELVTDDSPSHLSSLTAMEPGKLPDLVASAGEWAPPPPPVAADAPSLAAELPPIPEISEPPTTEETQELAPPPPIALEPEPAPASAPLGMPSSELHGLEWSPAADAPVHEPPPPRTADPIVSPTDASRAINPYAVDDVVEKVMAMLQPQIVHQITSELGKAIAEMQPQIIERVTREAIRPIAEELIRKKEK